MNEHLSAIAWSGGKDAWLALRHARAAGLDVRTFLTMCDETGASLAHDLPGEWIAGQVHALGGDSWRVRVAPGAYPERFDAALARLHATGHSHIVFGDIDLAAHRDWIAPRCVAQGLEPVFPLWGRSRSELSAELLALGVKARVVCVDESRLAARWCGRDYDTAFVRDLPDGICPCGEDGEFHTFVYGGPGFAQDLELVNGPRLRVANRPPLRAGWMVFQRFAGTAPWLRGDDEDPLA